MNRRQIAWLSALVVFAFGLEASGQSFTVDLDKGSVSSSKAAAKSEGSDGFKNDAIASVTPVDLSDPSAGFYRLNLPQESLYRGIIPNVRNWLPHLRNHPSIWQTRRGMRARNKLTWIGYQRMEDRTRVFIQTGRPAQFSRSTGKNGSVVITLENTVNTVSNFRRNIDARWYPRSVEGIRARNVRGRKVQVEIDVKLAANVNVTPDGNYIYVDFADASLEPVYQPVEKQKTIFDDPSN